MVKRLVLPHEFQSVSEQLNMSPAIFSGNHIFLSGMTGADMSGQMPEDPEAQFRNTFKKIECILREANVDMDAVVEMTSYHIGLRDHFELFDSIRLEFFSKPYPAWTAIEAAGLRREGALVEVRVIVSAHYGG
ncbi:RutC family protein YjgH [Pseudovibrio sp. Ad13]|uniref:RidA family protein n=1 Tax=unclassified Pseudovibrio TaxID=2627060 RepID=UPI0007AE9CF0|nr:MULTISPECIES: RidA family protein [unclassified Pseudovibrio]KZK86143.1 RutC family protein YjgH [Pseudovibrio sp. Ad13]KZK92411.1 RutC family protein YjgH [Pseudovibrio sp. W74]KZK93980.1 RutC family protein YjgH [Pseudovibrio sp. Ad46]KZL10993.1 RutC family protein YjgH [Pseudovibrio sp. Ad14]KZL28013.1 RutC family protein YjgH [Pseudovibrio sp. Ad37]